MSATSNSSPKSDWSDPLLKPFQPPASLLSPNDAKQREFRQLYGKSMEDIQAEMFKLVVAAQSNRSDDSPDIELPIGISHALTLSDFDQSCECESFFESLEAISSSASGSAHQEPPEPGSTQLSFPAIAHVLFSGHALPSCFSQSSHRSELASWLFRLSHEAAEQFAEIFGEASEEILSRDEFVKTAHTAVSCILGTSSYYFTLHAPPATSCWISYPEFRKQGIQPREYKANAAETHNKVRVFVSHDWISIDHPDKDNSTMARIESEIDYILQVSRFVVACKSLDFATAYNAFILDYVDGGHPRVAQYSQWLLGMADRVLSSPRDHMMVWSAMRAAGITDRPLTHEDIMIWYDYVCLPQVPRTEEQQRIFKAELPKVNELIQSALFLVVASRPSEEYLRRGWCLSEAILSETDTPLHISKFLRSPITESQDDLNDMKNRIRCACLMHGSAVGQNAPSNVESSQPSYASSSTETVLSTSAVEINNLLLAQKVSCSNGSDLSLLSQVLANRTVQGFFPLVNHFNEQQINVTYPIGADDYFLHCMGDWSLSMNIVHAFMHNNEISSTEGEGYAFEIRIKADPSKGLPGLFLDCVHRADALRFLIPESHRPTFKRISDVLKSVRTIQKKLLSMTSISSSAQAAADQLQEMKQKAASSDSGVFGLQGNSSTSSTPAAEGGAAASAGEDLLLDDYSVKMKLQDDDIARLRNWIGFVIVYSDEGIPAQELYQLVCQKEFADAGTRTGTHAAAYCKIIEGDRDTLMQQL